MEGAFTRELPQDRCSETQYLRMMVAQAADLTFLADADTGELTFFQGGRSGDGAAPDQAVPVVASPLHPDDAEVINALVAGLADGTAQAECEARFCFQPEEYRRCRVREARSPDGVVVGVVQGDLPCALGQEQFFGERDGLTGLLARTAGQKGMERALAEATAERTCALLVLDLDEFKLINDTLGHQRGDAVLIEFADILRSTFRQEDILCRIGGDEFCVVMRDAVDKPTIGRKAAEVLAKVRALFRQGYPISGSCSIGAAVAPADGVEFETVFHHADAALYQVKSSGKNSFMFYGGPVSERQSSQLTEADLEVAANTLWAKVAQQAFQVLYRSRDTKTALPLILKIVGTQLGVSRLCLMEPVPGAEEVRCTYEWHAPAPLVFPDKTPLSQLGEAPRLLERDGIFVCSDTQTLEGPLRTFLEDVHARAVLLCSVRRRERLLGYVWADDCNAPRQWTRAPRAVLSFLAELVSIFYVNGAEPPTPLE